MGPISGDNRPIQFDIGTPVTPKSHITIYFGKEDANSFRDKVKQSLGTQIMINDDDGFTPKDDIKRTGFDITPVEYHINRIFMGMTGDGKKREWKMRLDASNNNPSTNILFDIENAGAFLISLNEHW
ncbi:MAG: hypothetical protein WA667_22210 [Candidatus Nitrosopolaris sp.]